VYRLFLWTVLVAGISAIAFMLIRMLATPEPIVWSPTAAQPPIIEQAGSGVTDISSGVNNVERELPRASAGVETAADQVTESRYIPPPVVRSAASTEAEQDMPGDSNADPQTRQAIAAGRERTEVLRSVQQNLNEMLLSRQQIDVNDLDSILARLESLQNSDGTVGGLQISALRQNLNAANEMMGLVEQINAAAQAGADQQTMQSYVDQLQALQQQMQVDSQNLLVPGIPQRQGAAQ